jgi:polyphosphate kinase 2
MRFDEDRPGHGADDGTGGAGVAKTKGDREDDGRRLKGVPKLSKEAYETELVRLQADLVALQEWVKTTGQRVVVVFEGRDAAGKGSTIKRVTEYLNPRVARIVALPTPTEREKSQWYFQRYIPHLPAAGEIVLFDRSWYNRAGVERVMGYCTVEEYRRFLHQCPTFERMLVEDGIHLVKYWFSVSDEEQERRFRSRLEDPLRQWKFSPNDLLTRDKWVEFSRAKDEMFVHTDLPEAPWYVVEAEIKRHARLNMIKHFLGILPWQKVEVPVVRLPPRPPAKDYERPPRELFRSVPDHAAALLEKHG